MLKTPDTESPVQREQSRTAAHYDAYPFDFMTASDEMAIADMQPRPFRAFVDAHGTPGQSVADIGCGPGRASMYLVKRGLEVTAVDISIPSLKLALGRAVSARYVCGTNAALPFKTESFDLVVSDGVIHHTPDARQSLSENVRILRCGGILYLGVYKRTGHYYYIYTYAGPVVRWLERSLLGRALVYSLVFPLYYGVHLIKSGGRRTLRGARNFFYDYIITPRATFHSRKEILAWAGESALDLLSYDANLGNVHVFVFRKRGASTP